MDTIDPWGMAEFDARGMTGATRGPLAIATIKAADLVVSEKTIYLFIFFH